MWRFQNLWFNSASALLPMTRTHIAVRDREFIITRAKDRCEYCQSPAGFATQSFSMEHIIPVSRGGETELANLAWACPGCNGHKYNKIQVPDPADGKLVSLYNPRNEDWESHFKWDEEFSHVIGLTPTGRATVSTLKMNRSGLVNIRRALFAIGVHPPP